MSAEVVTPDALRGWPLPAPGGSKHGRGDVLVVGGARSTPGAAMVAGLAALRVGAGVLSLAVAEPVAAAVAAALWEAAVTGLPESEAGAPAGRRPRCWWNACPGSTRWSSGRGWTTPTGRASCSRACCRPPGPDQAVVLDAYALGVLGRCPRSRAARPSWCSRRTATRPHACSTSPRRSWRRPRGRRRHRRPVRRDRLLPAAVHVTGKGGSCRRPLRAGNVGQRRRPGGCGGGAAGPGGRPAQAACWGTYLHAAAGDRLAVEVGPDRVPRPRGARRPASGAHRAAGLARPGGLRGNVSPEWLMCGGALSMCAVAVSARPGRRVVSDVHVISSLSSCPRRSPTRFGRLRPAPSGRWRPGRRRLDGRAPGAGAPGGAQPDRRPGVGPPRRLSAPTAELFEAAPVRPWARSGRRPGAGCGRRRRGTAVAHAVLGDRAEQQTREGRPTPGTDHEQRRVLGLREQRRAGRPWMTSSVMVTPECAERTGATISRTVHSVSACRSTPGDARQVVGPAPRRDDAHRRPGGLGLAHRPREGVLAALGAVHSDDDDVVSGHDHSPAARCRRPRPAG